MRELEEALGIPQTIVSEILMEDLARNTWWQNLFHGSCHEQKEFHNEVAQDLLETTNKDPYFPKKVITGDESWVYGCDPETKAQSS